MIPHDIEIINIEINIWKRKWLICGSYNPQDSIIGHHLDQLGKLLDFNIRKYEDIVLLGDYNCKESEPVMEKFLHTYNFKNLVKKPTCFKNINNPRTIDLILTNKNKPFCHNDVIETGLSDFHQMPLTVLKCNYVKCKPKVLACRCFKNFDKVVFRHDLANALNDGVNNITYHAFEDTYLRILNNHAPLKQKYIRGNDQPFMNKTMRKAIMIRTKLRNIYLRNPTVENGMMFRKQRNYCVKLLKQTKINYYEHININLVTDNRKFWKCIKPSFSDKITTSYNYILYDNTEIIRNDREVADKFNSYFSNIALSLIL